jgi:hypothetical protein
VSTKRRSAGPPCFIATDFAANWRFVAPARIVFRAGRSNPSKNWDFKSRDATSISEEGIVAFSMMESKQAESSVLVGYLDVPFRTCLCRIRIDPCFQSAKE